LGILDAFKKKKDELNPEFLPQENPLQEQFPPMDQGMEGQEQAQPNFQNYGQQAPPQQQGFNPEQMGFERVQQGNYPQSQASSQTLSEINMGKDFELVNAKLDAIKAELDAISQRIKRIERMHESESLGKKDAWY
jgi:hypothetical protein